MNTALQDRIGVIRQKAIGDKPHTGAMVAFIPAESEQYMLALGPEDEDAEMGQELHVTMAFLGNAASISETDKMLLMELVQSIAAGTEPFDARAFAVNIFNPKGDEPCLVVGVGGNELEEPRKKLWDLFDKWESLKLPDNYNPWVPHMTLKYFKDKKIDWKTVKQVAENLPEKIRFDRIRVAVGGRNMDFPMLASHEDEEPDAEEASETKPVGVYTSVTDTPKAKDILEATAAFGRAMRDAKGQKPHKELGKCRYCKAKATKKIGIDGGAWIGTCEEHEERGRKLADGEDLDLEADVEEKAVRHVRTAEGSRRFGQPIGSIIVRDVNLTHLKISKTQGDYEGWTRVEDSKGKQYDIGKEDGKWYATGVEGGWDDIVAEGGSEDDVYKKLDVHAGKASTSKVPLTKKTKKLNDMTIAELRQYARDNGMSSITKLTGKTELLAAIWKFEYNKEKPVVSQVSSGPGFKKVDSEYEGYDQYEGDNGKTLWSYKEGNTHVIVDEDSNIVEEVGRDELLGALHRLLKKDESSESKKSEVTFEIVKARGSGIGWQIDRHEETDGRKKSSLVRTFGKKTDAEAHVEYLKEREAEDPGSTDKNHPNYKPFGLGNDPRTNEPKAKPQAKKPVETLSVAPAKPAVSVDPGERVAALTAISKQKNALPVGHNTRRVLNNAYNAISENRRSPADVSTELFALSQDDRMKPYGPALSQVAEQLRKGSASEPNSNGSKQGPGGQGHIPEDPDKVELTKPKDLDSGMMVNIGEGGWKYIGQVIKVTSRGNQWSSRQGTLEGQYRILDPWGVQIAMMSPNHTVEVDKNVPKRSDMRPKIQRRPYPSRETYFEPAVGVTGHQNPFEDGYPDFDSGESKIYGKPIRYALREKFDDEIGPNNFRTGRKVRVGWTVVRRDRDKSGTWSETVISDTNFTGSREEQSAAFLEAANQFRAMVEAERVKAGNGSWRAWTVPPQRRVPKAKPVPNKPQVESAPSVPKTAQERRGAVVDAYRKALQARGISEGYVYLTHVRQQLPAGMTRDEQDEAIRELNRMDGVRVIAEANQKTLTGEHRANAVSIGNQDKHLISINPGFSTADTADSVGPSLTSGSTVIDYSATKPKSRLPTVEEHQAAAKVAQKTQEGRDLRRGVIAYQQKSGEVKVLQSQWNQVIAQRGSTGNPKRDAELKAMAKAIRQAPDDDRDLYRGFSLPADVDVNTWLNTTQALPVTSFSSDRKLANTFRGATLKHGRRQVNVTLKGNGRKAVPIEVFGTPKYAYEREWLTAGAFRVTKVEMRQGHWHIEMEQTAAFHEGDQ
jgi:2'-5' RNA ligase